MASDEDYMGFLDKANKDPSEGHAKVQGRKAEFKTTDHGVKVPEPLLKATQDAFYVSDADEPFVPVALGWDESGKGLPDEGTFVLSSSLGESKANMVLVHRAIRDADQALGSQERGYRNPRPRGLGCSGAVRMRSSMRCGRLARGMM